jgi:hypothetical protein
MYLIRGRQDSNSPAKKVHQLLQLVSRVFLLLISQIFYISLIPSFSQYRLRSHCKFIGKCNMSLPPPCVAVLRAQSSLRGL